MKLLKILYPTCCMLLALSNTKAQQQVSMEEAKKAAEQFVNQSTSKQMRSKSTLTSEEATIEKVHSRKSGSNTLMYEVIFSDGQGVLLSGSKACLPILGFFEITNERHSIFEDDVPDGLKFMLKEYEEQIALCFKNDTISLHHQSEWQSLQEIGTMNHNAKLGATPTALATNTTIVVPPLITSKWGQRYSNDGEECDAYNHYVTKTSSNCSCSENKCAAGCVAVAMAQLMNYWKYPVSPHYASLSAQWGYDWCNMADNLITTSPNYIKERNAIASLIKACGNSVNMRYCEDGCSSSADISDARNALVSSFGYSSSADKQMRMWHTDNTWKNRIKNDLNAGRPVLYGGQPSLTEDGHAFVCDGYMDNNLFHFNFGWRGSHDDWLTIDNLTPNGNNYNSYQEAIFYVYPNMSQDYRNYKAYVFDEYNYRWNVLLMAGLSGLNIPVSAFEAIPNYPPKNATTLVSVDPAQRLAFNAQVPASWYTISSGQSIEYVAHESIVLRPGFHAQAGSNFTARIEPCNNVRSSTRIIIATDKEITINNSIIAKETSNLIRGTQDINENALPEENKRKNDELHIHPNPTSGLLTIQAGDINSSIQLIEVYSTLGVKVFTRIGNNSSLQEINISHLPSQMYIIRIQINNQRFTRKFILKK